MGAVAGTLYGTTWGFSGTLFKISTAGKLSTLYDFDGAAPVNVHGTLYGTTGGGGAYGNGTVFTYLP